MITACVKVPYSALKLLTSARPVDSVLATTITVETVDPTPAIPTMLLTVKLLITLTPANILLTLMLLVINCAVETNTLLTPPAVIDAAFTVFAAMVVVDSAVVLMPA